MGSSFTLRWISPSKSRLTCEAPRLFRSDQGVSRFPWITVMEIRSKNFTSGHQTVCAWSISCTCRHAARTAFKTWKEQPEVWQAQRNGFTVDPDFKACIQNTTSDIQFCSKVNNPKRKLALHCPTQHDLWHQRLSITCTWLLVKLQTKKPSIQNLHMHEGIYVWCNKQVVWIDQIHFCSKTEA